MTGYIVSSILWAIAGLIVGYVLGRGGCLNADLPKEPGVPPTQRSKTDMLIGFAVVGLALASVIVMTVSLSRQQRIVDCQTEFNTHFVAALGERSDAAAEERAAQRALLTAVLDSRGHPQAQEAAIQNYLRNLADADRSRSDNPLPERPRCE